MFNIAKDLQDIIDITMQRCYCTLTSHQPTELHVFSDASMKAYGGVAYLKMERETMFVLARSLVVPLKGHTLPRLKLMAAVIASQLVQLIISAFQHAPFQDTMVMLWSDSQIVIHWLHSQKRLQYIISNQVQEFNNVFPGVPWHCCPNDDNSADLLTCELSTAQFTSSQLWHHDPPWLIDES